MMSSRHIEPGLRLVKRTVSTRRGFRGACYLFIAWVATAVVLCLVWPIQPRLTLRNSEDLAVVGITPDCQELITLTRRAIRVVDSNRNQVLTGGDSGPIEIWNLFTGTRRTVNLPGQSASGPRVKCDDETRRMLDPLGWNVRFSPYGIRGNWFEFSMDRPELESLTSDRPEEPSHLLLDIRSGTLRELKPTGNTVFRLSPTGRWFFESQRPYDKNGFSGKVWETASGQERLAIEVTSDTSICFSADDHSFACSTRVGTQKTTRVWNLETGEVALKIDDRVHSLAFSRSNRMLAGWIHRGQPHLWPREIEVLVWDVESGRILHSWMPDESLNVHVSGGSLQFADNDSWLLLHNIFNGFDGATETHARLNLAFAWNLVTNERWFHDGHNLYDPSYSTNPFPPEMLPSLNYHFDEGSKSELLCENTTGRTVFSLPIDAYPVLIDSSGKTIVFQESSEQAIAKWIGYLQKYSVAISSFVQPFFPGEQISRWSVVDIPTGRVIAKMPAQYEITWLSHDQKTWVTTSQTAPAVVNVWDFPPRYSYYKPLGYSMILPGLVILMSWMRRMRWPANSANRKECR